MRWMLIQKSRYQIETRYSPEEISEILKENTGTTGSIFSKKRFYGTVKGRSFKITAAALSRNSWRPRLHGTVRENHEGGSVVWVEAKLNPVVKGFGIFFMSFSGIFMIGSIIASAGRAFSGLEMLLFYFLLSNLAFHFGEKESRERLTELLEKSH